MSRLIKISLIIIFVLISSCNSKYNEPTSLFDKSLPLKSTSLSISPDTFNLPLQLLAKDSLLIVLDRYNSGDETFIYKAFNSNNGKTISTFGRVGRGPDEFHFPSFLTDMTHKPNHFGVYNARMFTFNELSLDSVAGNSDQLTIKSYPKINNLNSRVIPINNKHFFGSGFFDEGRYALSDTAGNFITIKGDYPFEDQFNLSKRDLGMAFQCKLKKHPNKPLIVSATSKSANLEIIKVSPNGFEIVKKINSYPTVFENNPSQNRIEVNIDTSNRYGYQNVTVTEDYIYALYSGETMDDSYHYTDKVLVFDWQGNPITQYKLDKEVRYIAANSDEKSLYAISKNKNNDHVILKFSLSS